ncbi:HAD domain-containing protein [Microtetraspora niveoalba]|uniref:HAD domain-containing protein n=1 Tax=Microtetraspora niveoalba TaxID=46175 RepID=UPI00082A2984|nr:HAD domain-containing protein [Microtetraspora niveoalba]
MTTSARPLVLLDVDGVLNPFHRPSSRFARHECVVDGHTYQVLLNGRHGTELRGLTEDTGAELVWATTWEENANEEIGPRLGLPRLPVIKVTAGAPAADGTLFKTGPVAEYVRGRPFVWFDDELTSADWEYLTGHPDVGDFLLIEVDPRSGLSGCDIDRARDWLAAPRA